MSFKFKFGQAVKNLHGNERGYVNAMGDEIYGGNKVCLTLIGLDGKQGEGAAIDEVSLVPDPSLPQEEGSIMPTHIEFKFNCGDHVRSTSPTQNLRGMITQRYMYINGCCRYSLRMEKLDRDGNVVHNWVYEQELELIPNTSFETEIKPRRTATKTGGPVTKMPRF